MSLKHAGKREGNVSCKWAYGPSQSLNKKKGETQLSVKRSPS